MHIQSTISSSENVLKPAIVLKSGKNPRLLAYTPILRAGRTQRGSGGGGRSRTDLFLVGARGGALVENR